MPYKVFIFVPAFGQQVSAATFLTTHGVMQVLAAKGIQGGISTLSFPDIAELRSMAVTVFYDTMDATHILMVDADMGFAPDLVLDMLSFGAPVVGTIYPQRKLPVSWAGSGTGEKMAERRGGFMKVEGVGMGCTLIHRDAIRIMLEKMPELVDERLDLHPARDMIHATGARRLIRCFEKIDLAERGVVSEDLSFCIRWQRCGGETWANINHRISHVGMFDYAGRYLDSVEANMAAEAQQQLAAVQVDPIFTIQPDPTAAANVDQMKQDHRAEAAVRAIIPDDMPEEPKKANGGSKPEKRRGRPKGAKNKKRPMKLPMVVSA